METLSKLKTENKGSREKEPTAKNYKKIIQKKRTSKKIFVISMLCIGVFILFLFTPLFNLKYIEVTGNSYLKKEQIIGTGDIKTGVNIFKIKLSKVKANLKECSYIKDVNVKRSLPNKISLEVVECSGVAVIPFLGSYIYIDEEGKILEVSPKKDERKLPQIVGLSVNEFNVSKKIVTDNEKKFEITIATIKEIIHNNFIDKTFEINVSDLDNILLNVNGNKVIVGSSDKLSYKIGLLSEIIGRLMDTEKGTIDLTTAPNVIFKANN